MSRLAKLQLLGPVILAVTIIGAELAASALAATPSSIVAWYLNIEIFGVFQRSHYVLNNVFDIPYFQLLFVAIPLLLVSYFGLALRHRLLLALASHLSFIYACFAAHAWYIVGLPSMPAASLIQSQSAATLNLSALNISARPQILVILALLIATSLSLAGSQIQYLRAIRRI